MGKKVKIGLDFGTTYSVISELGDEVYSGDKIISYKLVAPSPNEGALSASQESIVLKDENNELKYGTNARSEVGMPDTTLYKGFKMMLAENDPEMLAERGYTDEITPEKVISGYIDYLLSGYIRSKGDNRTVEKIVLGVPEVWFDEVKTIDCRTKLAEIVSSYGYVKEVELVSEPAAACAFFLDNYKRISGKNYTGEVLLIDFGGGTLDIVLCHANDIGDSCEVSVRQRCGDGINEGKQIGKAGLAFLEAVAKLALSESDMGLNIEQDILYECIYKIEDALKDSQSEQKLRDTYETEVLNDITEINTPFCRFSINRKPVIVTYGMLAQAYDDVIRKVLDSRLKEIKEYLDANGYQYAKGKSSAFKIQLIGGFCNFYLVQKQVEDFFYRAAIDERFEDIIEDRREREYAVSYGATLIANGLIEFKRTAPFHFGFARGKGNEYSEIFYAIHKGMEFIENVPYFVKYEDGEDMIFCGSKIPLLVYNKHDKPDDRPTVREPLSEYSNSLRLGNEDVNYKIGFSLDQSLILTLHIVMVDEYTEKEIKREAFVMNNVNGIFGSVLPVGRRK